VVVLFAQKHGRQGMAPGTSRPPLTFAGAAIGFPWGSGEASWAPDPQLVCVATEVLFSGYRFTM